MSRAKSRLACVTSRMAGSPSGCGFSAAHVAPPARTRRDARAEVHRVWYIAHCSFPWEITEVICLLAYLLRRAGRGKGLPSSAGAVGSFEEKRMNDTPGS